MRHYYAHYYASMWITVNDSDVGRTMSVLSRLAHSWSARANSLISILILHGTEKSTCFSRYMSEQTLGTWWSAHWLCFPHFLTSPLIPSLGLGGQTHPIRKPNWFISLPCRILSSTSSPWPTFLAAFPWSLLGKQALFLMAHRFASAPAALSIVPCHLDLAANSFTSTLGPCSGRQTIPRRDLNKCQPEQVKYVICWSGTLRALGHIRHFMYTLGTFDRIRSIRNTIRFRRQFLAHHKPKHIGLIPANAGVPCIME
jgi:hypothetical protein